jgi:hypothetical protein
MSMKKALLTTVLSLMGLFANAQVIPSAYDSAQDARMTNVQLHLERFHGVHSTGSALWFIGIGVAAIGIQAKENNAIYAGAGLNFIGTLLMIGSHKNVKRAAFVGRTNYNLQ